VKKGNVGGNSAFNPKSVWDETWTAEKLETQFQKVNSGTPMKVLLVKLDSYPFSCSLLMGTTDWM
jgi:hypothetical protein